MDALAAWAALMQRCRPVFTRPGFAVFADLLRGWVLSPGRRTLTRMIVAGDPEGRRAHDAYHRFVRAGRWSMTSLWHILAAAAVEALCPSGPLTLDVDDTLFHHRGRNVNGAGWFRDAVRSGGGHTARGFGLNLVVVTLRVTPPWGGPPLGLPINVRLHRKDGPSQPDHARTMLSEIAAWFPHRCFIVCADGAYAGLLGANLPRTRIYTRMRSNAALFEPAPPRTGRPGRPRTRGDRLPTPTQLAAAVTTWSPIDVHRHHRSRRAHTWTRTVLWYSVQPDALVRLVIVRDPAGNEADVYLVTDHTDASPADVITRYMGRWSVEVTFRDSKQHLGGQHPQTWRGDGPLRAAALSLWLHSAVWTWYIGAYGTAPTWTNRPWHPTKDRPSFHDALAALRRLLWSEQITPMPSTSRPTTKYAELLIDILADAA